MEKKKCGKPTVMTTQTLAKLDEGFEMGFTDSEACLYAGIGTTALYEYCKRNKGYAERKEALKNTPKILAKKVVLNGIKDGDKSMSKWYLERKSKAEFALQTVNINTEVENIEKIDEVMEKLD